MASFCQFFRIIVRKWTIKVELYSRRPLMRDFILSCLTREKKSLTLFISFLNKAIGMASLELSVNWLCLSVCLSLSLSHTHTYICIWKEEYEYIFPDLYEHKSLMFTVLFCVFTVVNELVEIYTATKEGKGSYEVSEWIHFKKSRL